MFSGYSEKFRVLSPESHPGEQGPSGRDRGCRQLAAEAKGDYLLFLNSVERIEAGLIYSALYRMKIHSLSLLSLFTDQKMKTFGEGQVVPLVSYILFSLLPLRLILLSRSTHFAAASGQFMLFNARHYKAFQWHLESDEGSADGTSIMKRIKELGFRAETLLANGYVTARMYSGFGPAMKSLSEILVSGFERSAPALLVYLLLCGLGYLFILPVLSMQLLGMALALIVCMRIMVSLMGNQPVWWNLLFHPVQMVVMVIALSNSIFRIVRKFV
ncbi:MAG TPA: glycosyltransferase family 2 protein [Anseongella sp.]|nr:glycosyltransferase family 2 protein [Anseongella sp.]